jgi:carboxypeptidase C (cathepsin A)
MNKLFLLTLFLAFFTGPLTAQEVKIPINIDSTVTTKSKVSIKGQLIPYTATTGTQPVWDKEGKPIAGLYFTYYERSDVKDRSRRPLIISFNGALVQRPFGCT